MALVKIQPYITDNTASFTFGGLTITANAVFGNAILGNLASANFVSVESNITSGNANLGNLVTANYFSGNGSYLTSLTGANVTGYVPLATAANTAATVTTAAQPNITSVGTLSSLSVSGLITATGTGIKTSNIQDSTGTITITTRNGNIAGDVGVYGNLTVGTSGSGNVTASYFIGDGSLLTGLPASYSNANVASYLPTYTGNVSANYFIGNGSTLTSITGANVSGYVSLSTTANVAGTVTTAAQPNITSVGTLSDVTITGNITSGNANLGNLTISNYFRGNGSLLTSITGANVTGQVANALIAGTVYTNAQPNITSVGTLTGLTSNGVIDFTNTSNLTIGNVSNLHIAGGSSGYVLTTNGSGTLSWAAQSGGGTSGNVFANITSDTFTGNGVATTYTLSVTPTSINETTINYNGTMLLRDAYSLSGANVIFDNAPANGSYIEVTTLATANSSQYATTGKAIAMAIVFGF